MTMNQEVAWLPSNRKGERSMSSKQIANMVEPGLLSIETLVEKQIVFPELDQVAVVDAYREIRTRMLQSSKGGNKVTLISGAVSGSSTDLVALNLAAAFAFDESKTALIVDCNVRNPSLNTRLDLAPQYGLTDFLENEKIGLENIIFATGIPRLRFIPVGQRREHYSEYFTSLRMKALLEVLRRRYPDRHVFLNAPSAEESADTRILAHLADQAILVLPYGKAIRSQVEAAIEVIDRNKLLGVLMHEQ